MACGGLKPFHVNLGFGRQVAFEPLLRQAYDLCQNAFFPKVVGRSHNRSGGLIHLAMSRNIWQKR